MFAATATTTAPLATTRPDRSPTNQWAPGRLARRLPLGWPPQRWRVEIRCELGEGQARECDRLNERLGADSDVIGCRFIRSRPISFGPATGNVAAW